VYMVAGHRGLTRARDLRILSWALSGFFSRSGAMSLSACLCLRCSCASETRRGRFRHAE
jgi:hypothetical protein